MFPEVGAATVRVLRSLGQDVGVPRGQTCCGQIHSTPGTGTRPSSSPAGSWTRFAGFDAVVTPSPSCAAMVRAHHATVADHVVARGLDPTCRLPSMSVAPRVYDLAEYLVDVLGVADVGADYPHRVAYHPTCHSLRLLRVGDRPLRLLRASRAGAGRARGRRGVLRLRWAPSRVKNADTSVGDGADKVAHVRRDRRRGPHGRRHLVPDALGGCLVAAARRVRVVHLAEILAARGATRMSDADGNAAGPRASPRRRSRARSPSRLRLARALADAQLRSQPRHATTTIRTKRARVVAERDDWEELAGAGAASRTTPGAPPRAADAARGAT